MFVINRFIHKIRDICFRIGKRNLIIATIVVIVVIIVGLYSTFALDSNDNYSLNVKTYKFIIGDNYSSSVTIPANSAKYLDVSILNGVNVSVKYALYYNLVGDIDIGYLADTEYPTSGEIKSNKENVISLYVINNSYSDVNIELGVDYGNVNGGDISSSGTRIDTLIDPLYGANELSYDNSRTNENCYNVQCMIDKLADMLK